MVPEKSLGQMMAHSITLDDPGYKELLGDANSPQYHDLLYHLQDQVGVLTHHFLRKCTSYKEIIQRP